MIELIPAIDIIEGKCVRLTKGDYAEKKIYHEDPVDAAKEFEQMGLKRLHVVDLDGARSKHVVNLNILKRIATETNLCIDFGGGIKSDNDIESVFACGAQIATIGSVAVTNSNLFCKWIERYGSDKIILGADIKNNAIAINGWKEDSGKDIHAFIKQYAELGVRNIMCTDISKDGTLAGPAFELYEEILSRFPDIKLIASGGVSSNDDIIKLENIGVPAVVFGKAYYEHKINIKELTKYA